MRDRSVGENIALSLEVTGHFGKKVREKVSQVLAEVGLQAREKDSILYLSAGEQQRVAISLGLWFMTLLFFSRMNPQAIWIFGRLTMS